MHFLQMSFYIHRYTWLGLDLGSIISLRFTSSISCSILISSSSPSTSAAASTTTSASSVSSSMILVVAPTSSTITDVVSSRLIL